MTKQYRIALIDDHDLVRAGTRQYLERAEHLEIVGEASNSTEAKILLKTHLPDVVFMDIKMPGEGGIDLTSWVRQQYPTIKIIMLSAYDDDPFIMAALEAGANGYMLKNTSPMMLINAVQTVMEGKAALDPAITTKVMELLTSSKQNKVEIILSDRELEVLGLTAKGLTNKEIGQKLSISNRTVQGHLRKIFSKLDVNSRTEAVAKAISLQLLDV